MKFIRKLISMIAGAAAVLVALSLLAQWLSCGHEGHRYLCSRELTDEK